MPDCQRLRFLKFRKLLKAQTPGSVSVFSSEELTADETREVLIQSTLVCAEVLQDILAVAEDMGYKGKTVPGEVPGYGAIFMSNSATKKECFQRKLFGLPLAQSNFVLDVKKGMYLFLFEFERRQLHGVYRATSDGEIDIEPNAFRSSGKWFPAQVPFTSVWNCHPLAEHEFKDAIRDNYFSWKKFKFGLSKDQVDKLMMLFRSKRISKNDPAKTCFRYDDKPAKRDTRYSDNRKKVRDRIKLIKEEDGHGFDFDEVKGVHNHGYRTNKEVFLKKYKKESDDFGDRGSRKLDKRVDRSLRGSRRMSDASLHFMCDINNGRRERHHNFRETIGITNLEKIKGKHDIEDGYSRSGKSSAASIDKNFSVDGNGNKNNKFRDDSRIRDEHHVINGFSQNRSAQNDLCSPDRGSEAIVDGWFFPRGTVDSQQRTLSKSKGVTDVCQSPNYEPRTSPFESRGAEFGIRLGFNEEFDLGNVVPTTDSSLSNCNKKSSHFIPNSSPIDNHPIYPSETIPYHSENKGPDLGKVKSKPVLKDGGFDRLTSAPKALKHEQELESDETSELDATVNKVSRMLENIVSSPLESTVKMQSTFQQDDDDDLIASKIADHELPKMESDVKLEAEVKEDGSILQETRVVDFKCCKEANKNFDDEVKEITAGNTSGTDSDVGTSCKRRRLARPVSVKKESMCMQPTSDENAPLKVDCYLRTTVESSENIEGQKGAIEGEVHLSVKQNENAKSCEVSGKQSQDKCGFEDMAFIYEKWGFDDMATVYAPKYDHKMCGWIEE